MWWIFMIYDDWNLIETGINCYSIPSTSVCVSSGQQWTKKIEKYPWVIAPSDLIHKTWNHNLFFAMTFLHWLWGLWHSWLRKSNNNNYTKSIEQFLDIVVNSTTLNVWHAWGRGEVVVCFFGYRKNYSQ